MGTNLLVAVEGGGVKKCGLTDVFVFLEVLYFWDASVEMWLIRRVSGFLWVEFVCPVGGLGG